MMNIVLLEPEMPSNTGNIGRTCVATNTRLHLIEPLGFKLNEKALKRAGLDYWDKLDVSIYSDYQDFLEKNPQAAGNMYFATTKAHKVYSDVIYSPDCYLMFGKESAGIPETSPILPPLCFMRPCARMDLKRWSWRESCIIFPGIARSNIYKFTFSVRNLIICDKIPPIL